ncbi:MAG TPA: hypothetical protein VMH32_12840 [Burkholderiales bacterium]|nr:hypothetical protein [Burkholderiales bacterium]
MSFAWKRKLLGPTVLISAFALPAVTAMADVVGTSSPNEIGNGFGRAGGAAYSYWMDQQPGSLPAPVVKAYHATKEAVHDAYQDVKALTTEPPTQQQGPQRYGRAGGYMGLDILHSPIASRASG